MIELTYGDFFGYLLMAFIVGVIYEHFTNKFDYNTGKYRGNCVKWSEEKSEEKSNDNNGDRNNRNGK